MIFKKKEPPGVVLSNNPKDGKAMLANKIYETDRI